MEASYTQAQLVAEARRHGYRISAKLVERWVTIGLLDQARAIGRSRGKGVDRRWPEEQRQLLLSLLQHHRQTQTIRALTNIPVFVWLLWGEDYIPVRQVRRCLETYCQASRDARTFRGTAWARKLVRDLTRPGAPARAKEILVDELLASVRDGALHETELRRRLVEVVGPEDPGAQVDGPRAYAIVAAQWALLHHFYDLTDAHFRWARAFYLYGQADYAPAHKELAADPRFGRLHQPFDLQHIANSAAENVRFILSMALDPSIDASHLPEALRLETWLSGRAQLRTEVDVHRSPLWVPRGMPDARLAIGVHIEVAPRGAPELAPRQSN